MPGGMLPSPQTVAILVSLLQRLMFQTPSQDAMYLAVMGAGDDCVRAGIDIEDYIKVINIVEKEYKKQRRGNPLSSMF